jgi:His-Xaa-Ser system radical SAM maturase HxsC
MADIGLSQECNSSCIMCTSIRSADLASAKQEKPPLQEILGKIDRLQNPDHIALTGGEPTLREDLFEILDHVFDRFPDIEVALLTNGRRLAYKDYCRRLVESGLKKFIIPIHAHEAELHDFITRSEGSFKQTLKGLKNLSEFDVNIEVRVIIHGINYPFLAEIARLIKKEVSRVDRVVLLYFDAIGSGAINKERLFVKMEWVVPYLQKAIDELEGYNVQVYHFPSCVLGEEYRKYSVGKTVEDARITFGEDCEQCSIKAECSGVWKTYEKKFGMGEFKAVRHEMQIAKKRNKRVVLVWPLNMSYSPSISILYQSKMLERAGYDVSVVFSNLLFSKDNLNAPREFLDDPERAMRKVVFEVAKLEPDFVVVDSWREHSGFLIRFTGLFKESRPDVKLIVTGHNPTFIPEEVLELMPQIDYLVRDEAEFTIVELIDRLSKGENVSQVKGVSFLKDKRACHTEKRIMLPELDTIPFIDYENVVGNIPNRHELRSSRGCVGKCSFCSLPKMGEGIRFHSTDYMLKQIKHLKDLYDFDYVHFIDELFLCKPEHSRKLAEGIGESFSGLKWGAMLRSDLIRREIIEIMGRNGFNNTVLGVESVSPKVLEFLNKSQNPAKYISEIPKAIEIVAENVRTLELGMIVGTPVETREDLLQLGEFAKEVKAKYESKLDKLKFAIGGLVVYPGTRVFEDVKAGKLRIERTKRAHSRLEEYLYDGHKEVMWVAPQDYSFINSNFESQEEFERLVNETIRRWGN